MKGFHTSVRLLTSDPGGFSVTIIPTSPTVLREASEGALTSARGRLCSLRLNPGNISPAPLPEVGQADAYVEQLQVKCSSLCSETARTFLGLRFKDSGGGVALGEGGGGSLLCPPTRGRQVHRNAESAAAWAVSGAQNCSPAHRASSLLKKATVFTAGSQVGV